MVLLVVLQPVHEFDRKVGRFGIKQRTNEHLFSVSALLLINQFGREK